MSKKSRYMNFEVWFGILEQSCKKQKLQVPDHASAQLAWRGGWRVGQFVYELDREANPEKFNKKRRKR